MSLILLQGTLNILEEENHIKDVLSRIVVEMIKREWPQHWPDMLVELDTLSKQGVCSTAVSLQGFVFVCSSEFFWFVCPVSRKEPWVIFMMQNMFSQYCKSTIHTPLLKKAYLTTFFLLV